MGGDGKKFHKIVVVVWGIVAAVGSQSNSRNKFLRAEH